MHSLDRPTPRNIRESNTESFDSVTLLHILAKSLARIGNANQIANAEHSISFMYGGPPGTRTLSSGASNQRAHLLRQRSVKM